MGIHIECDPRDSLWKVNDLTFWLKKMFADKCPAIQINNADALETLSPTGTSRFKAFEVADPASGRVFFSKPQEAMIPERDNIDDFDDFMSSDEWREMCGGMEDVYKIRSIYHHHTKPGRVQNVVARGHLTLATLY